MCSVVLDQLGPRAIISRHHFLAKSHAILHLAFPAGWQSQTIPARGDHVSLKSLTAGDDVFRRRSCVTPSAARRTKQSKEETRPAAKRCL
ncbi:hypothetical protein BaRGS_00012678 [Batillaria attramentaria]|uniref:Uncharacterized protein n=1 Tax=Batillaria attramentaria TaxID=370345 RepID=A0ABD0L907_9CAEN